MFKTLNLYFCTLRIAACGSSVELHLHYGDPEKLSQLVLQFNMYWPVIRVFLPRWRHASNLNKR